LISLGLRKKIIDFLNILCGLLYISKNPFDAKICDQALATMDHRGPDNLSSINIKNNYFGHVRLSIIDLNERSNQPLKIDNKIIIYNGEIYNYKELIRDHNLKITTQSDTEVLLRMFILYGKDCLKFFNGMFSFVIYDEIEDSIFIARDRLGIKPLYYRKLNNSMIVSSEIQAILKLKSDDFDQFGLRQYKKLRMTIKGYTTYKNIKQFPPGHFYDGKFFHSYWKLNTMKKSDPKDDDLKELIEDSVRLRKRSDVPVGSFLSGGLDSTILSFLLKPTHTWTIGFKHLNEFNWSEKANSQLHSYHKKILMSKKEFLDLLRMMVIKRREPLSVPNEVLIYKMAKEAKKKNTVVLSGEGADELFWGYDRIFRWAKSVNSMSIKDFDKYYCYGTNNDDEVLDFALENIPGEKPLDRIAYYFQIIHLQGLLRRLDNSTMLCSVEARVPFVDHRLIEMMAGTSFRWRMGKTFKDPLKRLYNNLIPQEIIDREKVGFPVPLKSIFQDHRGNTGMDQWLNHNLELLKKV
tara:strand:+ start:6175 stop:7737 length:1563 start_codon:yes stop_codon:yes gene_type:complete